MVLRPPVLISARPSPDFFSGYRVAGNGSDSECDGELPPHVLPPANAAIVGVLEGRTRVTEEVAERHAERLEMNWKVWVTMNLLFTN